MAMTSVATPVSEPTQATKHRWKASASSASQHGQQAQQQDLVQPIHRLAALPWIRQITETPQKNDRLREHPALRTSLVHRRPLHPNQWTTTDSAPNAFVTPLFHPIDLAYPTTGADAASVPC